MNRKKRIVLGVSGASGLSLALHLIRMAASHPDLERLHIVFSPHALRVAAHETDPPATSAQAIVSRASLADADRDKVELHPDSDIGATIASGSYPVDGMAVVPCTSATLASIAHGISRGLIQRAADITLKERRPLVLALRETPFSLIHAENIVAVTRAGAIVAPPIPAFYAGESWDQYLDHFAMRVLDLLGLETSRGDLRWSSIRGGGSEEIAG